MEVVQRSSSPVSHRSSPSPMRRSPSPPRVVKRERNSALDISTILGTSSNSSDKKQLKSPIHSVKALDVAFASRPLGTPYKPIYPYQALTVSTHPLGSASNGFPLPDAPASALTSAGYNAYPFYGFSLPESASTTASSLRLTALLASRRRRAAQSNIQERPIDVQDDTGESSRKKVKPVPEEKKDQAYWERRRKNNDAAKRSRDARRAKEEEIALRAVVLEQDNMKLRAEVSILKSELARLHYMVYNC
ncbi:Cell death specification protein 2 [Holothuria leucospilota]|uniref:Cell death specification protein 2 n=1 Tax=Holothuria leucospilota TaxID=206669 RepID=A0A9Q1CGE4_HOLLE|nr:Cell death specification protein 2 [Holothuria leucospilota]